MTEIFEELEFIGDPVSEEGHVVHLLASLPESYDMVGLMNDMIADFMTKGLSKKQFLKLRSLTGVK